MPSSIVESGGPEYKEAACVLNGIKNAGVTKIGFVGNEKYVTTGGQ